MGSNIFRLQNKIKERKAAEVVAKEKAELDNEKDRRDKAKMVPSSATSSS